MRLPYYDYAGAGMYFVTIVANNRECLFGSVIDGEIHFTDFGRIVEEEWLRSAEIRHEIRLDEFVIMPNHVHAIVAIDVEDLVTAVQRPSNPHVRHADLPRRPGAERKTLGTFVGGFKIGATKRINAFRDSPGAPVWQRGYYDHIVRDESSLDAIRRYIEGNLGAWADDAENPASVKRT